ncbi:hypothetical protein A2U01_0072452, partial [Trifolium medium]|nr:hypothetical protein [Trifolium medium]
MERMKIGENFSGLTNLISLTLTHLPPMKTMERQRWNPKGGFSGPRRMLDRGPKQGVSSWRHFRFRNY